MSAAQVIKTREKRNMLKIGHRGAPLQAPENTLSSFQKALALGADAIELDVHACKSCELVVIHDETVDRTTDGKGSVGDMTLAQLQALHIACGERIPILKDVLEVLGDEPHYFIEVKKADDALGAASLIDHYIKQGWHADRLMMISFQHEALIAAHAEFPLVAIGASFEKMSPTSVGDAHKMGARAILPHYKELSDAYIHEAHEAGIKVIPWTVNQPGDIARLRAMGVDGIISDYPDRLN